MCAKSEPHLGPNAAELVSEVHQDRAAGCSQLGKAPGSSGVGGTAASFPSFLPNLASRRFLFRFSAQELAQHNQLLPGG